MEWYSEIRGLPPDGRVPSIALEEVLVAMGISKEQVQSRLDTWRLDDMDMVLHATSPSAWKGALEIMERQVGDDAAPSPVFSLAMQHDVL